MRSIQSIYNAHLYGSKIFWTALYFILNFRHEAHQIYTYIGEVCVSVNPYTTLNIYSDEHVTQYKGTQCNMFKKVYPPWNYKVYQDYGSIATQCKIILVVRSIIMEQLVCILKIDFGDKK